MRKIAGGLALVALLVLTGCSSGATEYRPADPFTVSDALGATGGLLLIPALALVILAGVRHAFAAEDGDPLPRWALYCYFGAGACLALAVLLWIVAIWGGVGST